MEFNNGNLAAVATLSDLIIIDDGQHVEFKKGDMFVRVTHALIIQASGITVDIKNGEAYFAVSVTGFAIKQFSGTADLVVNGRSMSLAAGQQASWSESDPSVNVAAFEPQRPEWARR